MTSTTPFIPAQPFIRLGQANLQLMMRFAASPEVMSEVTANASQLMQQTSQSAMKLMSSSAFSELARGLGANYLQFLSDVGEAGFAMVQSGQAEATRQAQSASDSVIQMSTRGRRSRSAA